MNSPYVNARAGKLGPALIQGRILGKIQPPKRHKVFLVVVAITLMILAAELERHELPLLPPAVWGAGWWSLHGLAMELLER